RESNRGMANSSNPANDLSSCEDEVPSRTIPCAPNPKRVICLLPNQFETRSQLGCFLYLRAKLDDLSALQLRSALQGFREVLRYVKLNDLCHDNLLDLVIWVQSDAPVVRRQFTQAIRSIAGSLSVN